VLLFDVNMPDKDKAEMMKNCKLLLVQKNILFITCCVISDSFTGPTFTNHGLRTVICFLDCWFRFYYCQTKHFI